MARAVLLYRETCRKCRVISALIVLGALGVVRRVGFGTPEGRDVARALGLDGGKLVLAAKGDTWRTLIQSRRWLRDSRR